MASCCNVGIHYQSCGLCSRSLFKIYEPLFSVWNEPTKRSTSHTLTYQRHSRISIHSAMKVVLLEQAAHIQQELPQFPMATQEYIPLIIRSQEVQQMLVPGVLLYRTYLFVFHVLLNHNYICICAASRINYTAYNRVGVYRCALRAR